MSDTEFERLIAALIHAAKFGEPVGKDSRGDLRAHVRALEERAENAERLRDEWRIAALSSSERIAAQDEQIKALQAKLLWIDFASYPFSKVVDAAIGESDE